MTTSAQNRNSGLRGSIVESVKIRDRLNDSVHEFVPSYLVAALERDRWAYSRAQGALALVDLNWDYRSTAAITAIHERPRSGG